MDFSRLEKSIMDVIKEEQAKLGYRKEKIRLYYPLSSLNHFFQVEGDVTGMLEKLNWFSEYTKQRLGQVEVTNEGERFCFHIPEEGVEYVHEQMKENEFIKELIGLLQKHDCTMEEIFDLFRSHSEKVEIHEMDNGESFPAGRLCRFCILKWIRQFGKIKWNQENRTKSGGTDEINDSWNGKCHSHGVL